MTTTRATGCCGKKRNEKGKRLRWMIFYLDVFDVVAPVVCALCVCVRACGNNQLGRGQLPALRFFHPVQFPSYTSKSSYLQSCSPTPASPPSCVLGLLNPARIYPSTTTPIHACFPLFSPHLSHHALRPHPLINSQPFHFNPSPLGHLRT